VFLGVCDGLSKQFHLGSHGLEPVKAEDMLFQDDVNRVLVHQLLEQLGVTGLRRWLSVRVGHYYHRAWSPQLTAAESCTTDRGIGLSYA